MRDGGGMTERVTIRSRADGDGAERLVFILGAPRSGTSWIQNTLAAQAGWATVPELHYAVEVLRPILKAWHRKADKLERALADVEGTGALGSRVIGMPASLELEELIRALRAPIESLVERATAEFGPVDVFLEKTPSNSVLVPYLTEAFPDAYLLHVVRDPRTMVRSLRSASGGWGATWAPRSVIICALIWRTFVAAARRGAASSSHYFELTYEEARADLPAALVAVRTWLGQPERPSSSNGSAGHHQVVSSRVGRTIGGSAVGEPDGFGDGSTTRRDLTGLQVWLVEAVTAKLMEDYGYAVRYASARRLNRLLEAAATPLVARLPASRREDIALNLRLLRPTAWLRSRLFPHG